MPPTVRVLSTGGTIASTADGGGAAPSLSGAALVEAVPELRERADVDIEEIASKPGFDVDFETMAAVGERARAAADGGAAGVVVTHGTDTLEETAYFLDLTCGDVPCVVVGAQRRPDERSPDGPANLLTAVAAAVDDRVSEGAYVAFNDELHAARDVTKAHTNRLDAFRSPDAGPVAVRYRSGFRFYREPRSRAVDLPVGEVGARVALVTSAAGVDGRPVERAVSDGVDGLVVAGTGLGNATGALGDAVADAVDAGVPVVVASRCHGGATDAVYGTRGGGVTLRDHGAVGAGDLPPWKARVKLALALSAVDDPMDAARFFDSPGDPDAGA